MNKRNGFLSALVLACALLVSCWHPLFDPEISASQVLANRLGDPVVSFTLEDVSHYYAQDAWFVPQRTEMSMESTNVYGMLIRVYRGSVIGSFVYAYPSSDYAYLNTYYSTEYENLMDEYPFIAAAPSSASYDVLCVSTNEYAVLWNPYTYSVSTASFSIDALVGGGCIMDSSDETARLSLCYVLGLSLYYETIPSYSSGDPGFTEPTTNLLIMPSLAYLRTPGTFFDTGTYLYLSCGLSDGTDAIFRWEYASASTSAPVRYPAAYGPIVAVLSDGRLMAYNGAITTVLSADMKKLFSFPSGTLRFVHERWNGSQNICVFTRATFLRNHKDDQGSLKVEVFEIATADLAGLGT
jgi:hypothetical protein